MATEALVEPQIDDGRVLVRALQSHGIDVAQAFWAKVGDDGRWLMYLASSLVDHAGQPVAYQRVSSVLQSLGSFSFGDSDVKLIGASNPIAQSVETLRHSLSSLNVLIHASWLALGPLSVQEVWIYCDL